MAVDPTTYDRYLDAERAAKEQGRALVEVLDYRQLLVTQQEYLRLKVTGAEDIQRRFQRQSPNKLMSYYYGRVEGTPAEMFAAVRQWLETVIGNMSKGTLEDL